ncbi:MAG: hypothetical protein DI548_12205 [Flavobacterium johnsoniae]|nr:MAG: hypothetical protein DI548_12205 [Flavobacterium johnsoniae]
MDNEILFTERQRFKQWWLWFILLGINGLFLFGVIKQVVGGEPYGDKPMSNTGLILTTALTVFLTFLFVSFRLETIIRKDGIYVRFFPFHLKFRHYAWETLTKSYVRQYAPIAEYGGNKGLQLEFTDNKKLLIGTNKPDELTEILKKLGQLKQ